MNFHRGHFYMHKNALDIAIQVVKVRYIGHESVTLIANIFNLGYVGNPQRIMTDKNYTIPMKEYDNYRLISEEEMLKVRTKPGRPE